ncbi:hypothetical protein Lser_V15G15164 [Lactuca serriola]
MVVDDTPPNSSSDNPPPPPPQSTNLPPPPPSPSHPPPRTPLPPPNSPLQSDIVKKGENDQGGPQPMQIQVMIVPTPSQPKMTGRVEVEADPQKQIVVVEILDANATTDDQPILNIGDQLETDDYEGFLDLGFTP